MAARAPKTKTIALLGAAGLAVAGIVAFYFARSSPPSGDPLAGAVPAPPPELAFVWHEPPLPRADLAFEAADGSPLSVADFAGRTLLVNLWATWCAPCIREMPALDRLQARLGGDDFAVIVISQDREGLSVVEEFWREAGLNALTIYIDPDMSAGREIAAPGLPTTMLIDGEGRETGRVVGPAEWDTPEAVAFLAAIAGVTEP